MNHSHKHLVSNSKIEWNYNLIDMNKLQSLLSPKSVLGGRSGLGGPRDKLGETVYCTHCYRIGKDEKDACMTKKNLKRHTRMYHPGSEAEWMIIWKERNLMEDQNPNPAMTPKTTGRTFIWCKHCFSEGKKQEECRMMKKNLKRHSASKKHANEAFLLRGLLEVVEVVENLERLVILLTEY